MAKNVANSPQQKYQKLGWEKVKSLAFKLFNYDAKV